MVTHCYSNTLWFGNEAKGESGKECACTMRLSYIITLTHSPSSFFAFKVGGELSAHELFIRREGTLLFKFDQTNKGKHPDDSLDSDGGAP